MALASEKDALVKKLGADVQRLLAELAALKSGLLLEEEASVRDGLAVEDTDLLQSPLTKVE